MGETASGRLTGARKEEEMEMRKRTMLLCVAAAFLAAPAAGDTFGWEDGASTILGCSGNLIDEQNVDGPFVHTGARSLRVTEAPHSGTPQAWIAWITGIRDDDVVRAGFRAYDEWEDYPSLRLHAHYTPGTDFTIYMGDAFGPMEFSDPVGWDLLEGSWNIDTWEGEREGLVIEARLYSTPTECDSCATDFWIDDLYVDAPAHATVYFPLGPSATDNTSWGGVKNLFR
ncbi:MAG: hypothetical protein JW958_05675 [Candidatus Eisenbacteria bacterium]|nr:hypothetical protein [Candidatus Eisenbacteria bacterium]